MQNIENNGNDLLDILGAIELPEEIIKKSEKNIEPLKMVTSTFTMNIYPTKPFTEEDIFEVKLDELLAINNDIKLNNE